MNSKMRILRLVFVDVSSSAAPPRSHHQNKLGDSNVGHKLLQKMGNDIRRPPPFPHISMSAPLTSGWQEGAGLGRREQGIVEPIAASSSANNESKSDQYKGIGHEDDPFEQFRRQKAKGYVSRLIAAQAETAAKRLDVSDDDPSVDRHDEKKK